MKYSIYFYLLIVGLCFIITLTSLPADRADLSMRTRSGRELNESERVEIRSLETKQVIQITEYYFSSLSEFSAFHGFLSYTQHNYQPQVQSYILRSFFVHSPPLKRYS